VQVSWYEVRGVQVTANQLAAHADPWVCSAYFSFHQKSGASYFDLDRLDLFSILSL
jgi:hypothetical protein